VVETIVRERRLRWPIVAHFEDAIRGQTVRGIDRRAKYILIRFDNRHLDLASRYVREPATGPNRAPRPRPTTTGTFEWIADGY